MIEIAPSLYVGSDEDWLVRVKGQPKWAVLHCAKEPYHRELLGYTTPGAPKDHPDYLFGRIGDEMCLNMVDSPKSEYFSLEMVRAGVNFVFSELIRRKNVLIHCNQGHSRAPIVALLFMARHLDLDFLKAEAQFKKMYPPYNPGTGAREFAIKNWSNFKRLR